MWKIESRKRSPTNEERLGLPPVVSERKLISNVTFNLSFMINANLCTINLLIKILNVYIRAVLRLDVGV
jgi:hypothetical protein